MQIAAALSSVIKGFPAARPVTRADKSHGRIGAGATLNRWMRRCCCEALLLLWL